MSFWNPEKVAAGELERQLVRGGVHFCFGMIRRILFPCDFFLCSFECSVRPDPLSFLICVRYYSFCYGGVQETAVWLASPPWIDQGPTGLRGWARVEPHGVEVTKRLAVLCFCTILLDCIYYYCPVDVRNYEMLNV